MKLIFRRSFAKDLKKIRKNTLRQEVQTVLEQIEQSTSLHDIPNLKHLTNEGPYYRIRIGDYRLGLLVEDETITIVRFLHRRDIYRYFP
ncbi:type II toxin-antitoxin system RelE family toxin [Candidatus Oscillochloris fontis]|uniref:type II toxin-antitoxin system RelE family toxin n=1 Tax=Candidatus Oscillochloris fontis TaxID=2496868 RepID=UPI00101C9185|nr:type II toxin-antitoxin system RelE/ParE family toxin [Candidatus Oscillochloris fontis]